MAPTYDSVKGEVVTIENRRWECFLSQTMIEINRNCWFKMKLICRKTKTEYVLIWQGGRTGASTRIVQLVFKDDIEKAKKFFCKKFFGKTKNEFLSDEFNYVPNMYDIFNPKEDQQVSTVSDNGEKYLKEFENREVKFFLRRLLSYGPTFHYYSSKNLVPFPSLSNDHLEAACQSLEKINTMLTSNTTPDDDELNRLSNRFYMKVPHRTDHVVKISTTFMLKEKAELLLRFDESGVLQDSLLQKLMSPEIDQYFLSLKLKIEIIPRDSEEFKNIEFALNSTHGPTHTSFTMKLLEIMRIHREDEYVENKEESGSERSLNSAGEPDILGVNEQKRSSLPAQSTIDSDTSGHSGLAGSNGTAINSSASTRLLLWHGSRIQNFNGILRHGLKITPPNVPRHKFCMFGDGIYFTCCSSKAAQYSIPNDHQIGLLSLCDVELGESKGFLTANHDAQKLMGTEFQSVRGYGNFWPQNTVPIDNSQHKFTRINVGPLVPKYPDDTLKQLTGLIYNEYVVYNEDQVKIKYLLRIKMIPN